MLSSSSILISPLLLALFLAITQESRGQLVLDGFLDYIPDTCMQELNEIVIPCIFQNMCLTLIPTTDEIEAALSEAVIESCADVESRLCPITSRCPECKEIADTFFKCVIINNDGGLSQDTTNLINECPLGCDTVDTSVPATETPISVVVAPTEAPAPDSSAPTDNPDVAESTEAPVDSGAVNMMTSTVAIVSGATSFVLGWSSLTL